MNNNYMIGSHNSMSYLPAKRWYLRPIAWMGRCQSATIYEQFFNYNVRFFDLRIKFNNLGEPSFWHGIFDWGGDVYGTIAMLDEYSKSVDDKVYVRMILEEKHKQADDLFQEMCFRELCSKCRKKYENLIFTCGQRDYDYKQIYTFKTHSPSLEDKYSSMTHPFGGDKNSIWAKIDDLWPWLYAKLHNKTAYAEGTKEEVLLLDFVNIASPNIPPEVPKKDNRKRNFKNLYGLLWK